MRENSQITGVFFVTGDVSGDGSKLQEKNLQASDLASLHKSIECSIKTL